MERNQMSAGCLELQGSESGHRMSAIAQQFKIPNNRLLYKKRYPTGFSELDAVLNGGITAGLHCIGAISSLGKSTFVMQISDHIAKSNPVLVFSLEMRAVDLTAKAISRQMYIDTGYSKSSDILLNEQAAAEFSQSDWQSIARAADIVAEAGERITIVEGGADPYSVEKVSDYVRGYIAAYQKHPVVIIDYLQILEPPERLRCSTDKQAADYNLRQLKMLSDQYDLPIVLVSSFNRENYDMPVSFRSFKDSGNIEYSCDTVMGLQLKGVGTKNFNADEAKSKHPRELELKLLKQKYGRAGATIPYRFYTRYSYFEEAPLSQQGSYRKETPLRY